MKTTPRRHDIGREKNCPQKSQALKKNIAGCAYTHSRKINWQWIISCSTKVAVMIFLQNWVAVSIQALSIAQGVSQRAHLVERPVAKQQKEPPFTLVVKALKTVAYVFTSF